MKEQKHKVVINIVKPSPPAYDRAVLVDVLVHHTRTNITGCHCGWAELGRFWPEHVADVYESKVG